MLVLLRVVYDCYGLLRVIYGENQFVDIREKIFDVSKNWPFLSRILKSVYKL